MTVTENALRKRINRQLRDQGLLLRTARNRGGYENTDVGRFYVITDRNVLVTKQIDLEGYGRELGVLRDNEQLED